MIFDLEDFLIFTSFLESKFNHLQGDSFFILVKERCIVRHVIYIYIYI